MEYYTDNGLKRKVYDSPVAELVPDYKRFKPVDKEHFDREVYESEEEEGENAPTPYAVTNFRISDVLVRQLKSKGIETLFPIQALTFDTIYEGNDLVGRARTGQGKTLAFVLPILESLTKSNAWNSQRRKHGRPPSVLVLAPTRELAKQVHEDFEFYGSSVGVSTVCVYGGAPYPPQESALRRGVDVVVGTPGRIKDHLERGTLNLKTLKFRVLDEADEMLNMGFVDDVEKILGHVEDSALVQTLLFSATMPDWVKQIASRFLKDNKEVVDLVGEEKMKACASVRHLLLPCARSARPQLIIDVISCYSSGGRAIVFTETKNEASDLASTLPGTARALHGDIPQNQREVTLSGFRLGKFTVLVATDVAARGLDITDVQLIIQCEPPKDAETYIHRSGRTGRAGKTGISVMFYNKKKEYLIPLIERKAGFKFEKISAPQPADLARASASGAAESIRSVSDSLLPIFRSAAEDLVQRSGLSPIDVVAKAIAKVAGHTELRRRSLTTGQDGFATMILQLGKPIYTATSAFNSLRRVLSEKVVEKVKGMSLTVDGMGAVFDVPSDSVDEFLAAAASNRLTMTILESVPPLQVRSGQNAQGRGRGNFGGRGGGRGGGFNATGPGRSGSGGRGGNGGGRSGSTVGRGGFGSSTNFQGRGGGYGNNSLPAIGRGYLGSNISSAGRGGGYGGSSMGGAGRGGGFDSFNMGSAGRGGGYDNFTMGIAGRGGGSDSSNMGVSGRGGSYDSSSVGGYGEPKMGGTGHGGSYDSSNMAGAGRGAYGNSIMGTSGWGTNGGNDSGWAAGMTDFNTNGSWQGGRGGGVRG